MARKDKWASLYQGKVYGRRGSTEVVSKFCEPYGGNKAIFRDQMHPDADADAVIEFLGWQKAVIDGERRMRAGG